MNNQPLRDRIRPYLIDDLARWKRLHTIRLAAFWGAFGGAVAFLPAVAEALPAWLYGILIVVMSATIAVARVTKQPGAE